MQNTTFDKNLFSYRLTEGKTTVYVFMFVVLLKLLFGIYIQMNLFEEVF